jgi:hypothetical protein
MATDWWGMDLDNSTDVFDNEAYANNITAGKNGATPVRVNYNDSSDTYANLCKMVVGFQHVPSGQSVFFKAFISAFNESYNCDWASETVFGRTDPIQMFKSNQRQISLNFKVPAASESEAFENLGRVQKLSQFLYPSYRGVESGGVVYAQTIAQSPLIRLKVMNLLKDTSNRGSLYADAAESAGKSYHANDMNVDYYNKYRGSGVAEGGILGVIQSMQVNHNLENNEAGVIEHGPETILPKLIDVTVTFTVIHEKTLGYSQEGVALDEFFPYGVELKATGVKATAVPFNEHREATIKAQEDRVLAEQAIANAKARYSGMFSKMRLKGDRAKLAGGDLSQSERDYLASAVMGEAMMDIDLDDTSAATLAAGMEAMGASRSEDASIRGTYTGEEDY